MKADVFPDPSTTTGVSMGYPEGRRLPRGPRDGHIGEVRALPKATDDTIKFASRSWPQARPDDFDRAGRTWTDRATGVEFKVCRGNPLLGDDPSIADLFVVEDDSILFLVRADKPHRSIALGVVGGLRGTR